MDLILQQLGGLLLSSVPTIITFLILYTAYRYLVHNPMARALAERRQRTQGAIEQARAHIAQAEARTAEYEQKIRDAKVAIYQQMETRRHQLTESRTGLVAEARAQAEQQVKEARAALERDAAVARVGLEAEANRLASEIIRAILKPAGAAQPGTVRP